MYRIHQIKLSLEEEKSIIPKEIEKKLKETSLNITDFKIVKESIDARDKKDINLVYTVDFTCEKKINCEEAPKKAYEEIKLKKPMKTRPLVIGFGPCGIFAALILAEAGAKPIILEQGKGVDERDEDVQLFWQEGILKESSNVQFGEGGAGTFSDGKLNTGIKDIRIKKVLESLVSCGANKEILYKQKPHIGTDKLKVVIKNIREKIISLGGEIHFSTKIEKLILKENRVDGIKTNKGDFYSEDIIFAIGHSARNTFKMLHEQGVAMEQKPFSIGARIVHQQKVIDKAQYGDANLSKKLGAAEYKLSHHCKNGRGVYTFCMCPGGDVIIASSEKGGLVTNGMSNSARDGEFANSGLLVDVKTSDFTSDDPLAGIDFQRKYEEKAYKLAGGYRGLETTFGKFKQSKLAECLPGFAVEGILEGLPQMGRRLKGFDSSEAKLIGVETRSSSPVRILRNKEFMSNIKGLYPGGEGAGYAGGITSAAVDGIKIAEEIIKKY